MRGFRIVVTLMALMLMVPVHGSADMTAMQQSQSDEEQPDANNTTFEFGRMETKTTGLILAVLMTRTMKKISGTAKVQAVPSPWTLNLP